MMGRQKHTEANGDPWPYSGPLRRIDGAAPFNHYLWPLDEDWFWANRSLDRRLDSHWNIAAVALVDGRWLTNGFVREDESRMKFFPSRAAALRSSAAELLRTARAARRWDKPNTLSADDFRLIVNWIFEILGEPAPKILPPSPIRPVVIDLPLFHAAEVAAVRIDIPDAEGGKD